MSSDHWDLTQPQHNVTYEDTIAHDIDLANASAWEERFKEHHGREPRFVERPVFAKLTIKDVNDVLKEAGKAQSQ